MMIPILDLKKWPIFRRLAWSAALLGLGVGSPGVARASAGVPTPTYHREVVRILQKNCQDCHRPGQVAPFSLLSYEQAGKRAADIVNVTEARRMPPWPASTEEGGPFRDARLMSESEIATLEAWVEAGSPEGDPGDAPPPREWKSDWTLGPPDLVLTPPESFALDAEGRDEMH